MILREFAFLISRIFDFYFWSSVILFAAVFNTGLSNQQVKILLPLLIILDVIVPILVLFLFLKKGKISDIDITKRQERYTLFGLAAGILFLSTILVFFLSNSLFFILSLTAFLMALTVFLITFSFKISGHLFVNTGSIFFLNYLFDFKLIWLFTIVPLVAFARMYLKKHTLAEVSAGAIVGLAEPYLILKFFKLI